MSKFVFLNSIFIRKNILPIITFIAILNLTGGAAAETLYQQKPEWWDKEKVTIVTGKDYYDTLNKTLGKSNFAQDKIENWSVLGPFDDNKGNPFGKVYGPDKTLKFDKKEEFTGKAGKLKWTPWRKGTPCPVGENEQNFITFFYSIYKAEKAGKHFLIFTSDDGAEIWINKKKVYQFHGGRGMDPAHPDILEVNLEKGKNEILVKLSQGSGPWGLSLQISRDNPISNKIKTLTEVYNKVPNIPPNERINLSRELERIYFQLNDYPNFLFWFNNEVMVISKGKSSRGLAEPSYQLREKPDIYPHLIKYYMDLFSNPKLDKKNRTFCGDFILRCSLERDDYPTLEKFISIYGNILKTLMPKEYLAAEIKIQIRKGEYEAASKLVEELKLKCDANSLRHYDNLFQIVSSMKTSAMQLPIDWDLRTIKSETGTFLENKKKTVSRFIRQTLTAKAPLVLPETEKNLYPGSLSIYKKMFAPFIKEYTPDLNEYLKMFEKTGTIDQTSLLQRKAQLSVGNFDIPVYKTTETSLNIKDIKFPAEKSLPFPFMKMHQGTAEMLAEIDFISRQLEKQPPAYISSKGNLKIFQNYHEVVCLENNKLKWKYISPNSIPKGTDGATIFFDQNQPLINDGKVFCRLFKDSVMNLFCFDAESGKINWVMDEKKMEICSGISLWRDRLVLLAKEPDSLCRYYLVEIKKTDGEISRKTFLFASDNYFTFFRHSRIQADLFIPAPLIIDDQAYISTNNGVVISFDIMTGGINWLTTYNKASYVADERQSKTLAGRHSLSPIVDSSKVLFQPINTASLILLERSTGKQSAELIIDWKEIISCGNNQILIIDNQGNASFYSLNDLKKQSSLPGTEYCFIQKLNDGIMLQTKNKLVIYDFAGKLKKSFSIPEDTVAIFADHDSLFAYNSKNESRAEIEKFLLNKPTAVLNSEPDKNLPEMYQVAFKTTQNANYLISGGAILRLNPDGTPAWSRPIPSFSSIKIYEKDKYTYIFTSNQIFCLENSSGSIKSFFPRYGERLPESITNTEIVSPQGVAFVVMQGWWDYYIARISPEKLENLGRYKGDQPIAVFEFGDLLTAWKHYKVDIRFLRKDPQKGEYSTETTEYKLKKSFEPRVMKAVNDQSVLISNFDSLIQVNANRTVTEFNLTEGKKKIDYWQKDMNSFNIIGDYCIFKNYWDMVTLFDLKKQKDLSGMPKFTQIPMFINNKFIGISEKNIVSFDPANEKVIYTVPLDKQSSGRHFLKAFKFQNKIAFFFNPPRHYNNLRGSQEALILLYSPENQEPEKINFPAVEYESEFLDTGDALLIFQPEEKRVVRITKQEFDIFKSKSPNLYSSANTPVKYDIDGYPDEWDLNKFHKLNKNRFDARIIDNKDIIIAVEINDSQTIGEMGQTGIDDRYNLMLAPGAVAAIESLNCMKDGKDWLISLYSKLESTKDKGTTVAYSVKPDGSSCFIEIKAPLNKVFFCHFPDQLKSSERKWRGDLAFELFHTDYLGNRSGLLSDRTEPAFFPRIFFTDLKPK